MTSFLLHITAPISLALSMVVHIGSANVIIMISICARKSEIIILAQDLNAAKPKLMMRGGRNVSILWRPS